MPLPTVPAPDSGVVVDRIGKYRYVYKVLRTYRNEKGQPTCDRRSIGRLTEAGRLIPNSAYYDFYGGAEPCGLTLENGECKVKSIGGTYLIRSIYRNIRL
jgi:hypothetical protein